jgi:hypothetical protein
MSCAPAVRRGAPSGFDAFDWVNSTVDTTSELPEPVQALLRERIRSVEQLEALLLLHAEPARSRTEQEVAEALRINPQLVSSALTGLLHNGLIHRGPDGRVRLGDAAAMPLPAIDALARSYQDQRIEVLVFISQSAISRVRQDALRTFAGAFQITGRKKDG